MEAGAILFGISLICLFFHGPIGPCGPASLHGLIMIPVGLLSFGAAWIVSIGALLVKLTSAKTRSMLLIPVVVATALAASLAVVMKQTSTSTWTAAGWVILCVWPPTVAAVHAVQDRVLAAA